MEEIDERLHMQLLNFDDDKRKEWIANRKPFSVLFEITAKCNMNCIHCYLQHVHAAKEMSFEKIIEIIDILYEKGILFLTLTGGEILTRKDFLQIYIYAKKKGFLVELFTNGYLFNEDIINALAEYPPLLVDISLYGANEETYKKVTGISDAFSKVIENCKRLKEANVRVSLKSPIIDLTLPELNEMKKLAETLGIPFVYTFEICSTIDKDTRPKNHLVDMAEILRHEFANYYEQIKNGTRNDILNYEEVIGTLKNNKMVYSCNVAVNSFVIDFQGNMCPCMKLRHCGIKLSSSNYDNIWADFDKYNKQVATDKYKCKGCDAQYYCDICPADMDLLFGNPEYRADDACKCALIRKAFYEKEISLEQALERANTKKREVYT
ncbi:radical SAM protein [Candidatus Clostridium stratigraminis]|uniref:Radical SAM/SPASM domain-containing protein n=1 Tax=Candidatus Clostridium stratigraminis TaxID=3381661 RepID=A0ABW8TAG5_9CLOT